MAHDDRGRARLDHVEAGALADVSDVDDDPQLIHSRDGRAAELGQPAVGTLQATVTEPVARVVGRLHDAHAECVIGVQQVDVCLDRITTLEMQDDGDLSAGGRGVDVADGPRDQERQRSLALHRQPVRKHAERVPRVLDRRDGREHGGDLSGPKLGQVRGEVPGLDQRSGGVQVPARHGHLWHRAGLRSR